jgi:ATP-binding cassette subfamily B protein
VISQHRREIQLLVTTAWHTDKWRCLGTLLEPLGSLMFPVYGVLLGLLADSIPENPTRFLVGCIGLLTAVVLQYLASYVGNSLRTSLSERVGFAFDEQIAALAGGAPGLEHHERADYQNRLELLQQSQGILGQSLNFLVTTASAVVGALGTGVVLAYLHPVTLFLIAFALPTLATASIQQRWQEGAEEESAEPARLSRHLRDLSVDRTAGMELRAFGLRHEVLGRMSTAWREARDPLHRASLKSGLVAAARAVLFAIGFVLAVGFVVWRVSNGHGTRGDVVTAVVVCQQVQHHVVGPAYSIAGLGRVLRTAGRLLWLRDYAARSARTMAGTVPAAPRLATGIVFEHVSFRYPGSDTWVLTDVSTELRAGLSVAVVGENGAGKTSLVKLLARMYDPTEGRILVDGTDLRDIDIDQWRGRLTAAFQDFMRFELTASHSVGIGDLPACEDLAAVDAALVRAGATGVFDHLVGGPHQQLGSGWDGGIDLSVGQWQKVALGRALMRTEPLVVFFDEPTANLDAPSEHALFDRYTTEAARMGEQSGTVTLLVTHRFSTVRSVDRILVLEHGRLVQEGSHPELMASPGLYADLYSLQAKSFV